MPMIYDMVERNNAPKTYHINIVREDWPETKQIGTNASNMVDHLLTFFLLLRSQASINMVLASNKHTENSKFDFSRFQTELISIDIRI